MSEPVPGDPWDALRRTTRARIGLGRAGDSVPTTAEFRFRAAHAAARDAVHDELDVGSLAARLKSLWLGDPVVIESRAADRGEYLRRPDRGREPASTDGLAAHGDDLAIVLADGLSAGAVDRHGVPLVETLLGLLGESGTSVAPPVIAVRARVALGDHVGAALGVRAVLVLIGERPGLSATDSLGAYLTYAPRPGRHDAERNCVSNIRPPDGLGYARAAQVIARLLYAALRAGATGVALKDRSGVPLSPDMDPPRIR